MATFYYRVLDADGEQQTGSLEADSMAHASAELRNRGWVPVEMSQSVKTLSMRLNEPVQLFDKPGERDVAKFLRDLARLLKAGLALDDALRLLVDMQDKDLFARIVDDVREQIRRGEGLAASLSRHKQVFSVQVIASVQAGEGTGQLPEALNTIADTMEKSLSFRDRLRSALIYPTILMVVVAATFVLVVSFVIPQFAPLFEGNEDKLPWATRFVMGLADIFSNYGVIMGIALVGLITWFVIVWHNFRLRSQLIETACKIRVVRMWLLMPVTVRFTRTLGVCLQSGMALDKALAMSIDTVRLPHVEVELNRVRALVRRGELLSAAMRPLNWIPSLTLQFVKVGEQSGNMGEMLSESAMLLSQDYEAKLEKSLALFSPIVTLVMGGVVALLVGAVLLGIMSINNVAL